MNAHVPRWISEIAPAVAAGKSPSAQPAAELGCSVGGSTMLVTGTTGTVPVSPAAENWNVMKSTLGLSSSAAVPAVQVRPAAASVGGAFSRHAGKLNGSVRTL